jgi:alcohol dehydrogenase
MKGMLTEIEKLKLPPPKVGHRFDFSDMGKALALFKSGKTVGKIVLNLK